MSRLRNFSCLNFLEGIKPLALGVEGEHEMHLYANLIGIVLYRLELESTHLEGIENETVKIGFFREIKALRRKLAESHV